MNNGKLCALVIMLCIIAPLMLGYAWPVDSHEDNIYNIVDTKDVTADRASYIPYYTDLTDPYWNNMFVFDPVYGFSHELLAYNVGQYSVNNTISSNVGGIQDIESSAFVLDTLTTNSSGSYTITDFDGYISSLNPEPSKPLMYVTFNPYDGVLPMQLFIDNNPASCLVFYPDSDLAYYLNTDRDEIDHEMTWDYSLHLLEGKVKITGDPNTNYNVRLIYYYQTVDDGVLQYVDLNQGLDVPAFDFSDNPYNYDPPRWLNGYDNQEIDIILSIPTYDTVELHFNNDQYRFSIENSADLDGGVMRCILWWPGHYWERRIPNTYDYYLVHIDARSDKIEISGLMGMDGFLGDYNKAKRATSLMDMSEYNLDFPNFTYFDVGQTAMGGRAYWYIAHTLSDCATEKGVTGTYTLSQYTKTANQGQFELRYVTTWPVSSDAIQLIYSGNTYDAAVDSKGNFILGDLTLPLENLIFTVIGTNLYINGNPISDTATNFALKLNGAFATNVYYSDLEVSKVPGYDWIPGGFGLDWNGYCIAGLLTSGFSGIAASLYGRRSGGKMLLVGIVATMCAAAYLVLLMGNL